MPSPREPNFRVIKNLMLGIGLFLVLAAVVMAILDPVDSAAVYSRGLIVGVVAIGIAWLIQREGRGKHVAQSDAQRRAMEKVPPKRSLGESET
ncbi:MAG: hypothetical protein ACFB21_03285 [Opitutales bacterium]